MDSNGVQPGFYVLNEALSQPIAVAAPAPGSRYGEFSKCDSCGRPFGIRPWLPPYHAELEILGTNYPDLASVTAGCLLISERFLAAYRNSGLVGLSLFEPVKVDVIGPSQPSGIRPEYSKVDIARSNAVIDEKLSGYEWSVPTSSCEICRTSPTGSLIKRWARLVIEPRTWSGEDVFVARGAAAIIATARFRNMCNLNQMSNAFFLPAEQYSYDFYPWERKNWQTLLFDETTAVLRSRNTHGQYNEVLKAMAAIRTTIAAEQRNDWVRDVEKRCMGSGNEVAGAAGVAYRRLAQRPYIP